MAQFFKQEKEQKLDIYYCINITAVTSEAVIVSEILMNTIPNEGCFSTPKKKNAQKELIVHIDFFTASDIDFFVVKKVSFNVRV